MHRNVVTAVDDLIGFVQIDQGGAVLSQFLAAEAGIGADYNAVTWGGLVRGGAIDRDDAGLGGGTNRVSDETFTIADVIDVDLFVFQDAGEIEQISIDCTGSFIVHLRVGHAGAMEFGFEQGTKHRGAR